MDEDVEDSDDYGCLKFPDFQHQIQKSGSAAATHSEKNNTSLCWVKGEMFGDSTMQQLNF